MRLHTNARGLPPKIDASTLSAWIMADRTGVPVEQYIRGSTIPRFTQFAALTMPTAVTGLIGNCRRFVGTGVLAAQPVAAHVTALQASWTWSVWFRMSAIPAAGGTYLIGLAGWVDDELADSNIQAALGVDVSRRPFILWEHTAGVNVIGTTPDPIPLMEWCLFTVRKTVDGGGTVTRDLLVNGRVVLSTTGLTNSTGGTNMAKMRWVLGSLITAAGAVNSGFVGDVNSSVLSTALLSDAEVAEQYRRGIMTATPFQTHMRVSIKDAAAGTYRDVSEGGFYNFDFVQEVAITDDVDNDTRAAVVTLMREHGEIALAPLKGDSMLNNPTLAGSFTAKVDGWRQIQIKEARVPFWVAQPSSSSADLAVAFEGRIDEVDDSASDKLVLSCRDEAARAAERWIASEIVYPTTLGGVCGGSAQSREVVCQQIITDNGALFTLNTPVSPLSCMLVMQTPLPRGHLLPTIRALAQEIGWDVKLQWNPPTSTWLLTFFEPQRVRLAPHIVISPLDVEKTEGGRVQTAGVRNNWTVTYPNSATLDGEGFRLPASVTVTDATSITNYDERAAEVIEDASSQIDTAAEATRMVNAALLDTKNPTRNAGKTIAFDSRIEVGDIAVLQPSGLDASVDQFAAIRSTDHRWSSGPCRSALRCEGAPVAGYNRWLSIEAGRNGRPPIRDPGEALTGRGVGTLLPGVLDLVDRSIYLGGQKFLEIKNGDFARFTRGTASPPDAWDMGAGTWGTGITALAGTQLSGGFAIQFTSTTPQLRSQAIPIIGVDSQPLSVECTWQRTAGDDFVQVDLEWLDANKAVLSTDTLYPGGAAVGSIYVAVNRWSADVAAAGSWNLHRADGILPPSTARFVRVIVRGRQVGGAFSAIIVDGVSVYRSARRAKTSVCLDQVTWIDWLNFIGRIEAIPVAAAPSNIPFLDVFSGSALGDGLQVYDIHTSLQRGGLAPTTSGAFYNVKEAGKYRIFARVWYFGTTGDTVSLEIVKNGLYTPATGVRSGFGTGPTGIGGAAMISQRFLIPAAVSHPNRVMDVEIETYLLKGDRITFDMAHIAGAGTVVVHPYCGTALCDDLTLATFDMRITD